MINTSFTYNGSKHVGIWGSCGWLPYSDWCQKVNYFAKKYQQTDATNWLLFDNDCYQFSIQFFALLVSGKHIYLPPNQQPETIKQLDHLTDASSSLFFEKENKEK